VQGNVCRGSQPWEGPVEDERAGPEGSGFGIGKEQILMVTELKCEDLNVKGCSFTVQGETPKEVLEKASEHLREEHDIELPDPETILESKDISNLEESVQIVVQRLRKALNISGKGMGPV
jgi:predicted small metal-binding protein